VMPDVSAAIDSNSLFSDFRPTRSWGNVKLEADESLYRLKARFVEFMQVLVLDLPSDRFHATISRYSLTQLVNPHHTT
jgi:hypothetical protein